jgi:DnaJ-class molecular chaperone
MNVNPYRTGERAMCRACNGRGRFKNETGPVCPECYGKGYLDHQWALSDAMRMVL